MTHSESKQTEMSEFAAEKGVFAELQENKQLMLKNV